MKYLFCTLALLSLTIFGCSKEPDTYFRRLDLSENMAIKGQYPVSDEMYGKINCYKLIYDEDGRITKVIYLKRGRPRKDALLEAAQVDIQYYEGFEKRTFKDAKGNPMPLSDSVYSQRLKLDEDGHPIACFNYDENGNLIEDTNRVAQYSWTLDDNGNVVRTIFLNREGKRIWTSHGIYENQWTYDKSKNTTEVSFYNQEGKIAENSDGIARIRWEYDENGDQTQEEYFNADGRPTENTDEGVSMVRWNYDQNGNWIEQKFFGTDGQLTQNIDSVSIKRLKYDEAGDVIEIKYFGIDEQLTDKNVYGVAIERYEYDQFGNMKEISYYGTDDELKNCANPDLQRAAILRFDYTVDGVDSSILFLDNKDNFLWYQEENGSPSPHVVWVDKQCDKQPQIIKQPILKYPELARRAELEGVVLLKIQVDKEGKPQKIPDADVYTTAEIFVQPAIDAATATMFSPGIINDIPAEVSVVVLYNFKLDSPLN